MRLVNGDLEESRPWRIRRLMQQVEEMEPEWLTHGNRHDDKYLPWMPFQPSNFIAMLAECITYTEGFTFLDVGCGIGTKVALASEVFGLDADGVEVDADMAAEARKWKTGDILVQDALEVPGLYQDYDIIWLYRPFRDIPSERALEEMIHKNMKSGAILAGGAWELHPPGNWPIVIDDWEIRRGAWIKP